MLCTLGCIQRGNYILILPVQGMKARIDPRIIRQRLLKYKERRGNSR